MKILYVQGDLMQAHEPCIVHGCNAQGVMGSGVARAIRDCFPEAYERYKAQEAAGGLHLGQVIWARSRDKLIGNAITQETYGRDPNKQYVSYDAIQTAISEINDVAAESQRNPANRAAVIDRVALPLIGAGLGNGDWSIISELLETHSTCFQPVVYTLDGIIPGRAPD